MMKHIKFGLLLVLGIHTFIHPLTETDWKRINAILIGSIMGGFSAGAAAGAVGGAYGSKIAASHLGASKVVGDPDVGMTVGALAGGVGGTALAGTAASQLAILLKNMALIGA
jgi:hypothetical protein